MLALTTLAPLSTTSTLRSCHRHLYNCQGGKDCAALIFRPNGFLSKDLFSFKANQAQHMKTDLNEANAYA